MIFPLQHAQIALTALCMKVISHCLESWTILKQTKKDVAKSFTG